MGPRKNCFILFCSPCLVSSYPSLPLLSGVKSGCLVVCLPGSKKAVRENLDVIQPVLQHILDLISDDVTAVTAHHQKSTHLCPHQSGNHGNHHGNTRRGVAFRERHSPFPMVSVEDAVTVITQETERISRDRSGMAVLSVGEARGSVTAEPIMARENLPNYRASIKDGLVLPSIEILILLVTMATFSGTQCSPRMDQGPSG